MKVYCSGEFDSNEGISWDDLIDENGNFVATISTVDQAKKDGCLAIDGSYPALFIRQDDDGGYSIYKDALCLFAKDINEMVELLSKTLGVDYKFAILPN